MNSFTEENYIKAIYKLNEHESPEATTNAIAGVMQTKAASVTDMLKKLAAKKLINYKKYRGVTLTVKGERLALSIIRKHRLWEMFLVEKFNFRWDEVHDVAEQLEHIRSDKLIDELDKFLDYPKADPHGDPIPDASGKLHVQKSKLLSQFSLNEACIMTGVVDHSASFLQYLDRTGLALGNEIRIKEMLPFDRSLRITVNKKASFFISNDVAKNILVIIK